jgi:phosphoenolpyruvate synthase/pyruvate phosphate dikinase
MQKLKIASIVVFLLTFLFTPNSVKAQKVSVNQIKKQIEAYKKDSRGPYHRIKWFCNDGSVHDPKQPCGDAGGIQHATYKPEIEKLAKQNHLYFGNILSYNKYDGFWDTPNNHSRLKQYQIVKYLTTVDDGWIYRKGQFYRGAMQSEDEEAWGKEFYVNLLKDNSVLEKQYYLVKQSLKDIPHQGDSNISQLMRSQSKVLAEQVPSFMNIRIKIHGNPDKTDIQTVKNFKSSHSGKLSQSQVKKLDELIKTLETYYTPVSVNTLISKAKGISNKEVKEMLISLLSGYDKEASISEKVKTLTDITCNIRLELPKVKAAKDRLTLLDLSNKIDNSLSIQSQEWKPGNLKELIKKIKVLSYATLGQGMIEFWEWEHVMNTLGGTDLPSSMTLAELSDFLKTSRGVVEWSTAMVKAVYGEDVSRYTAFEPKAYQFIDDRVRSSIVLDLGKSVSKLGDIITKHSSIQNDVLDINNEATFRGLNPGYAFGELVVVQGAIKNIEFSKDKIYVFERPPSDLKPIAGILTVSEGNLVSHVQLLARNLGIPNAALSNGNLKSLAKFNGKKVFYAVSDKGNVIMKLESKMSSKEKALFSKEERNQNKIRVPVDKIQLNHTDVINLRNVKADDSGKICGPKAANLGQLKSIFPDHVVEGFVIPFGIFRKHLDNKMAGTSGSYWDYLNETYKKAEEMLKAKKSIKEIDDFQVKRLTTLRKAVEKMKLNDDFVAQMEKEFKKVFGVSLGQKSVFLRSDTNMEDLKGFNGAGLNLTLFNILGKQDILNGIKKVWASPYTERSLRWRQKYLLNPEYVFPSIVVIPGVNNDYSGVVITTGINEGSKNDMTVAFSRGVGGAVDGQAAETRLITKNSYKLLSPAREPSYLSLPKTGGTKVNYTSFEKPILNKKNMQSIRYLVDEVRVKVPERTDPDYKGAYDMEMGFRNDKLWLFQIRPFVENKKAKNSEYLKSIAPKINYNKKISLSDKI